MTNHPAMAKENYSGFQHPQLVYANSNLSFLSKLVEHVAISRFVRHAKGNRLFPAVSYTHLTLPTILRV